MMVTLRQPTRIKARKEHSCDYCDKKIFIGEEHTISTHKYDGLLYDWRTCDRCKPYVLEAFRNEHYSFDDGMTEEDFRRYMWEEHYEIAKEWWK